MKFALNCPKDCPPKDAQAVSGPVIRFVRHDPPTAADMKTYADEGKSTNDICGSCALSVLRRIEDVETARKAIPYFRKRLVAEALLTDAHGVIKQTGSHAYHYSFWVEMTYGAMIHPLFNVVPA